MIIAASSLDPIHITSYVSPKQFCPIKCPSQLGVNLDPGKDGYGGKDFGFMMAVEAAPILKVMKGSSVVFQIGGPGGGLVARANMYYVSLIRDQESIHVLKSLLIIFDVKICLCSIPSICIISPVEGICSCKRAPKSQDWNVF